MSGGSREPEDVKDVQCTNCGLYFSSKGIHSHRDSCDHPEWAEPLVPLEGESETDGSGAPERVGPTPSEGSGATDTSPEPEGSDPTPTAETDGGLGLAGAPEPSGGFEEEPVDEEPEPEAENEECPGCGHDLGATESELRERFEDDPFKCGSCGKRLQVGA